MKVLSLDFETSIGKTIHGATFRDPENDIYTQIWASNPGDVNIVHGKSNRTLVGNLQEEIYSADYIIGHNIGFDLSYIWDDSSFKGYIKRGGKIWDTQYAEYLLTGQQHKTASLAELQLKYLGEKEKPSRITSLYKKGIGADKIVKAQERCPRLWKLYNEYCRSDGATPLLIFKAQYIRAKREGMLPLIELYNDYLLGQINMSCTGIRIDVLKVEKLLKEYNIKHLEYLQQAQEILKSVWVDERLPIFNINSTDHKSVVLFGGEVSLEESVQRGYYKNGNPRFKKQEIKIQVKGFGLDTKLTHPNKKVGFYSTDDKVLAAIKTDSRTPPEVLKYCELQELSMKYKKAAKTYCQAFLDRSIDGVLYPHFNNTITPTGRLSSSEPNMQNIPSKNELAKDLMGCLVCDKGWKCVTIDFSQLEKWVQALVSGDENLIEKLLDGTCLHCLTLANIEGLDYNYVYRKAKVEQDKEWDVKRTNIKPIGFRMDYGGMPRGTATDLGLSLEYVESVHAADKALFPQKYRFFEEELPAVVKSTTTYSLACNIAASRTKGKDGSQLLGKAELLPIFDKSGNVYYNNKDLRNIGYWQTNYGKKYHFVDFGRATVKHNKEYMNEFIYIDGKKIQKYKNVPVINNLRRSFPMPRFKNYPNQGGAADIQGATTAEIQKMLLTKADKIRMHVEIHDSKLLTVRVDVLAPCLKWLKEVIENVPKIFLRRFGITIPFKFPVEIKVGDNFGEMKKYDI